MPEESKRYKPWIWRRLLILLLFSSLLPLGLLGLLTVIVPSSGVSVTVQPGHEVSAESRSQFGRIATAHAEGINTRLSNIGRSVSLLAEYATELLNAPEIFATQVVPELAGTLEDEDEAAADGGKEQTEEAAATPLDNPLFYSAGSDGAVRKLIDDGRPAVYFAKPAYGSFSNFDLQRLHALGALDPLLMEPSRDPLCTQSFVITRDNLLRTYPFRDFSLWPADKDLGKPRNFWSADKADANGLVWTSPYFSALTETWVVACMAAVYAGDRQIAVAGCEVDISTLSDELLSFTLGSGGSCWLIRPVPAAGDSPGRWTLLAAQAGARDELGAVPLSAAEVPDDKHTGSLILEEADVLQYGKAEFLQLLRNQINTQASTVALALPETSVITAGDGRYIAAAPINNLGWILGGEARSTATTAVEAFVEQIQQATTHRLWLLIFAVLSGLALAFILAFFGARRLTQPLEILTQQARQAAASHRTVSVAIADEGEIGAVADAFQALIDATTEPRNGNGNGSDSAG